MARMGCISRVSVFDAQSATVYLTERTDVAFRPFGLDLFDKLVRACQAVRRQLEREQRTLGQKGFVELADQVAPATSVGRLLSNITSLTSPETVRNLASLSDEEKHRLGEIERSLVDLQASDPDKLIRRLNVRIGRVKSLSTHIARVEGILSADAIGAILETRAEGRRKRHEAARVRETTFSEDMFAGTGSETWGTLWAAARQFSEELAYPEETFPATGENSRCVLCQQDLDHATRQRLANFEAFVRSTAEKELQDVRGRFARMRRAFIDSDVRPDAIVETLEELKIENDHIGVAVADWLAGAEERRREVVAALSEDLELHDPPVLEQVAGRVDAVAEELKRRIQTLLDDKAEDARASLSAEADELHARSVLDEHQSEVLAEIDRKRRLAAYGLCIDDTRTQAITRKSGAITRTVVTEKLRESFQSELLKLGFRHVEVELTDAGGAEGVLYHKIVLSRAPGVELPKVVSEGEQ